MTIARKTKPGRNDLCPCGSGLKMKRCHGSHRAEVEMKSTAVELSSIYHSSLDKAREQIRTEREHDETGRALHEWTWRAIFWGAIAFALFCILVGTSRGADVRANIRANNPPTTKANRPAAVSLGRSAKKLLPVIYVYSSPAYKQSVDFWNAYNSDPAFRSAIDASYFVKRIEIETCIEQVCRGVVPPEFHIPAQGNILFARVVRGFTTKDELLRRLGLSVAPHEPPPVKPPRPQPPQQYDLPTPRPPQVIADPTLLKELREMRSELDKRDLDYIEANNEQRAAINKQSDAIQEQTGIVDGLRKWLTGELVDLVKGKVGAIAGAAAGTGEAAGGSGLLQVLLVPLAAFLGITPIGAGLTAGSIIAPLAWWAIKKGWNKFRGQKTVTVPTAIPIPPWIHGTAATVQQPFPVHVDTPSPPQVTQMNREVVQYEGPNTEALAYAWAVEQYGRKHPGAETVVAWLENAKQQYLSGAAAAAQKKR